jgi:hypothetical protein
MTIADALLARIEGRQTRAGVVFKLREPRAQDAPAALA